MDLNIIELCRLCGKDDPQSKDLMDKINSKLCVLIEKYLHITLNNTMQMPSRICPTCEATLISFNNFVEQCAETQEVFKMMFNDEAINNAVKIEKELLDSFVADVKTENNEGETYHTDDEDYADKRLEFFDNDEDNDIDDMTIAQLKSMKYEKIVTNNNKKVLNKDLVKMNCHLCQYEGRIWSDLVAHCVSIHATDPEVKCVCGYSNIRRRSDIVAHTKEHNKSQEYKSTHKDGTRIYQKTEINTIVSFECLLCSKPCYNWVFLHKHCKKYHSTKPMQECKLCGLLLKSKSSIYRHDLDHRTDNVHRCSICPKILTSAKALKRHLNKHEIESNGGKCVCHECGKLLTSTITLKTHMLLHKPIDERKKYECIVCSRRFTTRTAMLNHRRAIHDKMKRFVCDLCGFSCVTAGELKQHRAIHSDDKPFTCPKCNKKFKTYSNMKTHMDIHAETSYSCDICNKVLNSKRTLRKHILVHQNEKKFTCKQCNKAFKRSHTLKVHMAMHTGDKPVSCKWCGEKFTYSSSLRAHRLRFHPDKNTTVSDQTNKPTYTIEVVVDGDMVYGKDLDHNDTQIQLTYKDQEDKSGIMNKILNL